MPLWATGPYVRPLHKKESATNIGTFGTVIGDSDHSATYFALDARTQPLIVEEKVHVLGTVSHDLHESLTEQEPLTSASADELIKGGKQMVSLSGEPKNTVSKAVDS